VNESCAYCGGPATEPDHLTGRGPDGRYFDPSLVVPSCRACNLRGWALWCATGVGLNAFEHRSPHEVRMERLGLSLTRLGVRQPSGPFGHFARRPISRSGGGDAR